MLKLLQHIGRQSYVDFTKLTTKELCTPQLIKKLLKVPVWGHERKSQQNLYQGKRHNTAVQTCFSQKKSNRWVRINVFKKVIKSELLQTKLRLYIGSKAFRTIKKYGGIDNYLLCMDPKLMDSKMGQYLQQLMYRKMETPSMTVPHILRTKPIPRMKAKMYHYKMAVNKQLGVIRYGRYESKQVPFGARLEQYDQEQYAKHLEVERIKRSYQDMQTSHPLLLELQEKMKENDKLHPQMDVMAKQARDEYLGQNRYKRILLKQYKQQEEERRQIIEQIKDDLFRNPNGPS